MTDRPRVERLTAVAFTVPTEAPESDGTLTWDHTSVVVVHATAAGVTGLGYAYGHPAAAELVREPIATVVSGTDAMDVPAAWDAMVAVVRNLGRAGVASTAISAVDTALWDLKARLLGTSLVDLLGVRRTRIELYGSGGFTSLDLDGLRDQLGGWAADGFAAVKMKVGREPEADATRVAEARDAVGGDVALMVDANGAHDPAGALRAAAVFAEHGVTWFEEPVSSDDLDGLRLVRQRVPSGMAVAAGEYGHDLWYFDRLLAAGAVDVLQPDATRCGGYTGFLRAANRSDAAHVAVSAHTAPQLHAHVAASATRVRHVEWFHDHVRIERWLFDGILEPVAGALVPDRDRPGNGLTLRRRPGDRFTDRG